MLENVAKTQLTETRGINPMTVLTKIMPKSTNQLTSKELK